MIERPKLDEARAEYALDCLVQLPPAGDYTSIIITVGHQQFLALGAAGIRALGGPNAVVFDVKGILPAGVADGRL